MDKIIFLQRLQRERDKFELLLNRVGFEQRLTLRSISRGISIKDMLADILSREQFIADRLSEIMHGESYFPCVTHSALDAFQNKFGYPDYESPLTEKGKMDHLVVYRYKNIGLDDIIELDVSAYTTIVSLLERMSESYYLDYDLAHRVAEHTYTPYRRVSSEIKLWLQSISTGAK